jgi:hypothetical protein
MKAAPWAERLAEFSTPFLADPLFQGGAGFLGNVTETRGSNPAAGE